MNDITISLEQVRSMVFGFAVGDALGVPVEFKKRRFLDQNPVTGMLAGGIWNQPIGTWSDDTSMVLAEMESIARLKAVDYDDIMKNFIRWADHAEFTATDVTFDIGNATAKALRRYKAGVPAEKCGGTGDRDNGNGSLMRILPFCPVCMFSLPYGEVVRQVDSWWYETSVSYLDIPSALTHAHLRSIIACEIYGLIALSLILDEQGKDLHSYIEDTIEFIFSTFFPDDAGLDEFEEILKSLRNYEPKEDKEAIAARKEAHEARKFYGRLMSFRRDNLPPREEIKSSGYVVDTLEAAIWCLLSTDNYRDAVLEAVNLGGDTDTVAAITGGLAGLAYGMEDIPEEWLSVLKKREYIEELCLAYTKAFEGEDGVYFK